MHAPTLNHALTTFLDSAANLRIGDIDAAIEHHTRQVDMLRLLRQLVEIREEGMTVGAVQEPAQGAVVEAPRPLIAPIKAPAVELKPVLPSVEPTPIRPKTAASGTRKHRYPMPGTLADRIWQLMSGRGEMKTGLIALELGIKDVTNVSSAMRAWEGRVFEHVSHGSWRLLEKEAPTIVLTHREEMEQAEASQTENVREVHEPPQAEWSEPLNGNAFRVRAYLQRSQPAKPHIIAADLKISISEVTMILQRYKSFRMNGKGWMLSRPNEEDPPCPPPTTQPAAALTT